MKKIIMMLLLAAPLALCAQKYAQVDYFALVQATPEFKAAQTELETMGKNLEKDLLEMRTEIETKAQKYQSEITAQTPENIRARKEQELQDLYQRYQQAEQDNTQAFEQAKQQKLQPVYQKVAEVIKALAQEGGYVYIMDKSAAQGTYIFLNDALNEDVTAKVAAKLGVTLNATPARPDAAK
jgi:outer membrane protein